MMSCDDVGLGALFHTNFWSCEVNQRAIILNALERYFLVMYSLFVTLQAQTGKRYLINTIIITKD